MRAQDLIEGVEHVGDTQVSNITNGFVEFGPEFGQHLLPGYLAVGNTVKFFFQ